MFVYSAYNSTESSHPSSGIDTGVVCSSLYDMSKKRKVQMFSYYLQVIFGGFM